MAGKIVQQTLDFYARGKSASFLIFSCRVKDKTNNKKNQQQRLRKYRLFVSCGTSSSKTEKHLNVLTHGFDFRIVIILYLKHVLLSE